MDSEFTPITKSVMNFVLQSRQSMMRTGVMNENLRVAMPEYLKRYILDELIKKYIYDPHEGGEYILGIKVIPTWEHVVTVFHINCPEVVDMQTFRLPMQTEVVKGQFGIQVIITAPSEDNAS